MSRWHWIWLLPGLAGVATVLAGEPLRHDPFARPLLGAAAAGATAAGGGEAAREAAWNPRLTALMVAGKDSLVTLDGAIIRIGEEKDGYRLIQVRDREAVFRKGGKRIVLKMEDSAVRQPTGQGGK